MPAFTSIAIAAGAATSAGSSIAGAVAAGEEADAQAALAQQQEIQARADRAAAVQAAAPTAQEMAQIQQEIQVSEREVARQEQLAASIDPAIVEASQQQLALLRGQEARTLDPLRRQQEKSRRQLRSQLRAQLGAGFETSTAGASALAEFEAQASGQAVSAQQQAISSLGQFTTQATAVRSDQGRTIGALAGVGASRLGQLAQRRTAAITGTPLAGFAGGAARGDIASAQARQKTFSALGDVAGTVTGAAVAIGTSGSRKKPALEFGEAVGRTLRK